jgi:putative effector of murein hydrolase
MLLGCLGGLGLGLSLAIELRYAENPDPTCASQRMFTLALFRAGVLGFVTSHLTDRHFGMVFGLFSAVALLLAYQLHFSVSDTVTVDCCPQLSGKKFITALIRGLFIGIAGAAAGHLVGAAALMRFGLNMGLTVGVVGVMVSTCSPFIEWYTDNLSDRLLGLFGIILIGCGMILQSLQYFVVFFDITVK